MKQRAHIIFSYNEIATYVCLFLNIQTPIYVTVPEEHSATAICTRGMREILYKQDNDSRWRY